MPKYKTLYDRLSSRISSAVNGVKKHWLITVIAGIFAFAAGVQATSWVIGQISNGYQKSIGWKSRERAAINKLGPSVEINYIRSIIGQPIYKAGTGRFTEYVFQRQFGYVQAVTDKTGHVMLYSVVDCRLDFNPTILLPGGEKVRLQKDTLKEAGSGETYYFISGATANSFMMERVYGGNPTNYQEYYLGLSDGCGQLRQFPVDAYKVLEKSSCIARRPEKEQLVPKPALCQYDIRNSEIDDLRQRTTINTVVITAPNITLNEISRDVQFGPDRIELRTLPNYQNLWR